jgi:hypothetical protein
MSAAASRPQDEPVPLTGFNRLIECSIIALLDDKDFPMREEAMR